MTNPRSYHAATRLSDGRVLVSGGVRNADETDILMESEIYDLATRRWLDSSGMMSNARVFHASSLLLDGKVLVSGGLSPAFPDIFVASKSVDFFDPIQGMWIPTGNMLDERQMHTSSVLSDGKVLVTGGTNTRWEQWDRCEL